MKIRSLAALALVVATLWGCGMSTNEPERQGDSSVHDPTLRAQTFTSTLRLDPLTGPLGPHPKQEELLVIEGAPPLEGRDEPLSHLKPERRVLPQELPRGGELRTQVRDRFVPLPLKHTDVKAQLSLYVSSVTVTQQYHNPYNGKIEAVYVFPLPDDAGIRDFVMQIGERRIRGIIRERAEAEQIYREARRQGHVASLLTQDRPNIFTQAVANIEPGKEIDIQITYFHTLRYVEGRFEFVFPMVVGPRYNPPGFQDGVGAVAAGAGGSSGQKTEVQYLHPGEISAADISLEVHIDAATEIDEVTSPTHAIRSERPGPGLAKVTLSPNDRIPNRDFVLRYRVAGRQIRAALATHKDDSGGYFTLLIQPPETLSDVPRWPREMIFVVDCSGSMNGRPLETAKRALAKSLKRLESDDRFQILCFSDRVWSMGPAAVAATAENVRRGLRFAEELQTEGGTQMDRVVVEALDPTVAPGRFRIVAFMTDGYIGNDREIIGLVKRHLGGARIFSFGVGDSVNRYFLEALARVGRGVSTFVTLDESTERAADLLFQRIEHPALTDLKIDWGAMGVNEIYPQPLPDLFVGSPVILTGRFKGQGPAKIQLSGRSGDRPFEMSLAANLDEPGLRHSALGSVWARSKIASLYDAMTWSGDSAECTQEIRRVALHYGLMSDFTAFVAVDSLTRTPGEFGTTIVQPVAVPSGVQYATTVEK
jgi:Ca-activated chloride channel family protein